jgi:hypothetical protein
MRETRTGSTIFANVEIYNVKVDSKQVEYEGMDWTHSAEDGSNGYLR